MDTDDILHAHIYTTLAISRSTEHLFIRVSINNISRDRGNCVLSREHEKCEQIEKDRMMNVSSVFLFACTSLSRSLSLEWNFLPRESHLFDRHSVCFPSKMSRLAVCTTRFESGRWKILMSNSILSLFLSLRMEKIIWMIFTCDNYSSIIFRRLSKRKNFLWIYTTFSIFKGKWDARTCVIIFEVSLFIFEKINEITHTHTHKKKKIDSKKNIIQCKRNK